VFSSKSHSASAHYSAFLSTIVPVLDTSFQFVLNGIGLAQIILILAYLICIAGYAVGQELEMKAGGSDTLVCLCFHKPDMKFIL